MKVSVHMSADPQLNENQIDEQAVDEQQPQDDPVQDSTNDSAGDTTAESTTNSTIDDLQNTIIELQRKLELADAGWKRSLADYQNLQRRTQEGQEKFVKIAAAGCIHALLEPIDNLLRAADHLHDKGVEMVVKQFSQALESQGVVEIEAVGKSFDPQTMEAVAQVPGEKGVVQKVELKGYLMYGELLRPAKVSVGNGENA